MEILTTKATRRSTRVRVEIPVTVTSLDRKHPFSGPCVALVVSAQGCGFRASQALPLETPVLLNDLPDGGKVSARVAIACRWAMTGNSFLSEWRFTTTGMCGELPIRRRIGIALPILPLLPLTAQPPRAKARVRVRGPTTCSPARARLIPVENSGPWLGQGAPSKPGRITLTTDHWPLTIEIRSFVTSCELRRGSIL